MENSWIFILIQVILIAFVIFFLFIIFRAIKVINLENRILRFSINSLTEKPISIFDRWKNYYLKIVSKISKCLNKINWIKSISKRYDKYLNKVTIAKESMDFISNKIIFCVVAIIISILFSVIRGRSIGIIQIIISILIGYFILDVFLIFNYRANRKKIEDDFLKAVLIMSNAFKSGRSIMQAVEFVSKELDGVIGEEFKKMYIDLSYGLDLEVVFERFASRVDLNETKYMASSLVIINNTGGDIIKIFSSIEKSFFEKKKLEDELKSVTALSNFVFKILVVIPFIVFFMIYIMNPNYFTPFITTRIGNVLLVIIILIYILYIFVVKRVMKIKE